MKVAEADQRIAQLAVAEQALKAFKEIGGRKQLVDRANALRAATYGTLTQMIDAQPDANLPADFADRVFRYERIRRRRKPVTAADLQKQILSNEKEHTALVELLATTQEAEAAAKAAKLKAKAKPVEDAAALTTAPTGAAPRSRPAASCAMRAASRSPRQGRAKRLRRSVRSPPPADARKGRRRPGKRRRAVRSGSKGRLAPPRSPCF
jgi:hypothetical protein